MIYVSLYIFIYFVDAFIFSHMRMCTYVYAKAMWATLPCLTKTKAKFKSKN